MVIAVAVAWFGQVSLAFAWDSSWALYVRLTVVAAGADGRVHLLYLAQVSCRLGDSRDGGP
jgi:hypothetical protein